MGESVVSDGTPAERAEHLVADEVIAAIESLSAAEKLRLLDIEKVYLRGTGFSPKELLHDAMCRAIVGGRKCPREVAFVAFLAQTMRGIAYHERKKRRREPPLPSAPRSEGKDDGAQVEVAADQLNPEEHLIEQEPDNSVAIIGGHFVDDEQ